jgi:hypothetical protein
MRSALGFGTLGLLFAMGCGGGRTAVSSGPMPPEGSFTGVYFSPQYGEMHMVQNGSAIVGKYKKDERSGSFQGEAEGDLARFEWKERKAMVSNRPQTTIGHGFFRYMIDGSTGDHVLKGRWGIGDDDSSGGEWNAYKSRKMEPNLEKFGADGEGSEGGESTEGSSEKSGASDESSGGDSSSGSGDAEQSDDVF